VFPFAVAALTLGLSLANLVVLMVFCGKALWKELRARFYF